ncbi:MAG: HAMP domain-containing sensor histidine kinase [Gallionella sp.]
MKRNSSAVEHSAQADQKKMETLFSRVMIAIGIGTTVTGLFERDSQLLTVWDSYMVPLTSAIYFVSGMIIHFRRQWLMGALLLSLIPTIIYEQGVMFVAVHYPSEVSYYAAAASGAFFPLLYLVIFITFPKNAAKWSLINCAGFYIQFLVNATLLSNPSPSPERIGAEHILLQAMMAHPIYILALSYIVKLRERLHATQQEAFHQKEDFLAMLSHEIRNLLQTMVGAIELLNLRLREPAEKRSVVRLQKAATQLQTYLSDINELTRLEDPALKVKKHQFDLAQLLADIRDEWQPKSEELGLKLAVNIQGGENGAPLLIDTDEARLNQIISNLVSNSLKYTKEGSVTVTASASTESPDCVTLEVSDTGIGIEEKYLEKIFQPYVRLENAKRFCSEGSGLGLAIVERLTASIGGSLQVESQLGQGTRFLITVPGLTNRNQM